MSDQYRRPVRANGFMGAATDPVRKNMSGFNPVDLAAMKQSGALTLEGKTVGDILMQFGISPDDPAIKLVEFGRKQIENADMAGKMANIAADAGAESGAAPPSAPPAGLQDLLGAGNGN